jgi:solute carrier family 35 protein F5
LIFGAVIGVERFTPRKLLGVIASLIGIILISRVDLSKQDTDTTPAAISGRDGSFPHKTSGEIALGDAMAAFSSIMYGIYTIVMKKQVGDESRVNMQLFFGLVGLFNLVLLWPGFFILHWIGIETFELPSTDRVWTIILVCSSFFFILLRCPGQCRWRDYIADYYTNRSTHCHPSSLILRGHTPCS